MMRWPELGSRPVVSVSRTICRMGRESTAGLHASVDRSIASASTRSLPAYARMALDPVPFDVVTVRERVELLPQILVLHGLLVRGLPAARLPARQPLGDALAHVLRIRVDAALAPGA